MNYLLDTHTLLWTLFEPERLSDIAQRLIREPRNDIAVSTLTFWEISLNYALGKLTLEGCTPADLPAAAEQSGFSLIAPDAVESATFWQLPRGAHKDPFDRMLVWQAIRRDRCLISKDGRLTEYHALGLKTAW